MVTKNCPYLNNLCTQEVPEWTNKHRYCFSDNEGIGNGYHSCYVKRDLDKRLQKYNEENERRKLE